MPRWVPLLLIWALASPALAAPTLSAAQLDRLLIGLRGQPDGRVALRLENVELSERVSLARLETWEAEFPGKQTRQQLLRLADLSAVLDPPAADLPADPAPARDVQMQMLARTVVYVRTKIPRLPDFYATRTTTHFVDTFSSQAAYSVGRIAVGGRVMPAPAAGVITAADAGLHVTGETTATVTYRDGREVLDGETNQRRAQKRPAPGLTSSGEFGPILGAVIDDVLHGGLRWKRWEHGRGGPVAVFSFAVPPAESHFSVRVRNGSNLESDHPAYHGELAIDPQSGAILRLLEQADMAPPMQAMQAVIAVEYAPVTIGSADSICPVRAVALSRVPLPALAGANADSSPVQIDLNDVEFSSYHRFASTVRIVANAGESSGDNAAAGPAVRQASGDPGGEIATAQPLPGADASTEEATRPGPAQAEPPAAGAASAASAAPRPPSSAEALAPSPPVVALPVKSTPVLAETEVLHTTSRLVLVDVSVSDHDRPVQGVVRNRFHIFENGREVPVASIEEHEPAAMAAANLKPPLLPSGTYSNLPVYPQTGSVNVLLLDALNTPSGDQERVRRMMLQYLGTIHPGTPMAIFTLSSRLRMAAGFTTDISQLIKVFASEQGQPHPSAGVGSVTSESMTPDLERMAGGVAMDNDPETARMVQQILQFAADIKSHETDDRVQITLDALDELARYLAGVSGRKNVIWFSGSFPIAIWPERNLMTPEHDKRDYSGQVQETGKLLAAARIAVYPVDARGLMNAPTADASYTPPPAFATPGEGDSAVSVAVSRDNKSFAVQTLQEQGTMNTIAAETGGHVYSTGNDLAGALKKILAADSTYYTLSYVPPPLEKKDKAGSDFRSIEVKVDGGKYQLAYRRGYYAEDSARIGSSSNAANHTFTEAMKLGSPPATQILFHARVLPVSDPQFTAVPGDAEAAGEKAATFRGGVQRYIVDLTLPLQSLTFAEGVDGVRRGRVQCALLAYDGEGAAVNSLFRTFELHLTSQQYEQALRAGTGVPFRLALDLPSGKTTLRIVVLDPALARAGSLEIPLGANRTASVEPAK